MSLSIVKAIDWHCKCVKPSDADVSMMHYCCLSRCAMKKLCCNVAVAYGKREPAFDGHEYQRILPMLWCEVLWCEGMVYGAGSLPEGERLLPTPNIDNLPTRQRGKQLRKYSTTNTHVLLNWQPDHSIIRTAHQLHICFWGCTCNLDIQRFAWCRSLSCFCCVPALLSVENCIQHFHGSCMVVCFCTVP